MKVRRRLLIGSLLVSAVASVAIGLVIARSSDDSSDLDAEITRDDTVLRPPGLGTNAVLEGDRLPEVTVQNLAGDAVSTIDLEGQPLVINIWGSTCAPCKEELPAFAEAHLRHGDSIRFVGVSYLPPSEHEEQFARDRGVSYELLYDADGEFVTDVGIAAFPVPLFVAADGTIVQQPGRLTLEGLTAAIEDLLL